ncbi:hypothetical protein JRQ81_010028, partial [Phrynocephalus forsythii]
YKVIRQCCHRVDLHEKFSDETDLHCCSRPCAAQRPWAYVSHALYLLELRYLCHSERG